MSPPTQQSSTTRISPPQSYNVGPRSDSPAPSSAAVSKANAQLPQTASLDKQALPHQFRPASPQQKETVRGLFTTVGEFITGERIVAPGVVVQPLPHARQITLHLAELEGKDQLSLRKRQERVQRLIEVAAADPNNLAALAASIAKGRSPLPQAHKILIRFATYLSTSLGSPLDDQQIKLAQRVLRERTAIDPESPIIIESERVKITISSAQPTLAEEESYKISQLLGRHLRGGPWYETTLELKGETHHDDSKMSAAWIRRVVCCNIIPVGALFGGIITCIASGHSHAMFFSGLAFTALGCAGFAVATEAQALVEKRAREWFNNGSGTH